MERIRSEGKRIRRGRNILRFPMAQSCHNGYNREKLTAGSVTRYFQRGDYDHRNYQE